MLAELEQLDARRWVISAIFIVNGVGEEHARDLDHHVGHTRRLASGVAPLLDVAAFESFFWFASLV